MQMHGLFPAPVAMFTLGRDLTPAEQAACSSEGRELVKNQGNAHSADTDVLRHPALADLRVFIEGALTEYVQAVYCPKTTCEAYLTISWLNYNHPGDWHHTHAHPNAFISGVFYPLADKVLDRIYFHRELYQQIEIDPVEWNLFNAKSWWFPVGTGDLLLFPSRLTHNVEPAQTERISLSFNTFLRGELGQARMLTHLSLAP
jgi:uncharacterized protein (TIGR02466 family)